MTDPETRAREALALKNNAFLTECFDAVEDAARQAWLATRSDDTQGREMAYLLTKAVHRVKDVIQSAVDDGQIAAARAARPLDRG